MKAPYLIVLTVVISVIVAIVASRFISSNTAYGTIEIPMDLEVAKYVGINVDTDALHFGMIHPPGSARREFTIQNTFKKDMQFTITTKGNMAPLTEVTESSFILKPGETKTVRFEVKITNSIEYGNYSGQATINYYDI